MTTHELAKKLLAGENVKVLIPAALSSGNKLEFVTDMNLVEESPDSEKFMLLKGREVEL